MQDFPKEKPEVEPVPQMPPKEPVLPEVFPKPEKSEPEKPLPELEPLVAPEVEPTQSVKK
jgi:hypothetical protein